MEKQTFLSPSIEPESIENLSQKLLEANLQLSNANRELEKLQQERETMLANISHDLRAPITAIRSAIDYLTSGQNIRLEDYESSIRLIDHRTATLENLIQDMYYLFCVEDTSKELDLQPIDALPFLEEYFYDATAASLYDDHEMILDLPEDLQCQIDIDVQKMVRVLDNLFTNAAKYTPKGSSINLRAKITSDHQFLQIAVSDNGPGIPPEALPHLFGRTYTVSASRTPNSATGSGLGLAIVKAIVERHNGIVFCSSQLGKGSTFTIQLPIHINP